MSASKHTPGPWEFGPNHSSTGLAGQLVVRPAGEFPHGEWVADVGSMYDDHREANARLIAAAPDLLEALKQCRLALEPYDDVKPRDWKTDREKLAFAHQAACAAIKKVEGGAA